jgi:hypothetical protein
MVPLRNQSAFRAWVRDPDFDFLAIQEFDGGFDISWGKDGMAGEHATLGQHDGGHYLDTETFGREFALNAFKAILGGQGAARGPGTRWSPSPRCSTRTSAKMTLTKDNSYDF